MAYINNETPANKKILFTSFAREIDMFLLELTNQSDSPTN